MKRAVGLSILNMNTEEAERLNDAEIAAAPAELDDEEHGADGADDVEKIDLKATVAELAKLSPLEFDQVCPEQAAYLGVQVTTLRSEVKKARKGPAMTGKKPQAETDITKLKLSAANIIESDDALALFEAAWNKIMAGEQRNARLLYLMATTRLFDRCMSAAIKGPSSAGKSELRQRVLDFFPPEEVIQFTTMSERALLYIEGDFAHKILSMGEAAGAEELSLQDYLLRELISGGKLIYQTVQKVGDALSTICIEKNGPVCFFVTTTKAALNPENETRMMSIEVDDSGKQTTIVLDKLAEGIGLNAASAIVDFEPWRNFQRWLAAGNCRVIVPFARELAALIPPKSVRLRRDFAQILLAIKAHALIHRSHRSVDSNDQIVADIDRDYAPVVTLMGAIVAEASGSGVSKELQETIDAVGKVTEGLGIDEGASSDKIAKRLKLDQSAAWRRLHVAMNKGYVVNLETRRRQPGRYRLTGQEVEAEPIMPTPGEIALAMEAGGAHTAQTCIRPDIRQVFEELNECTPVCTNAPYAGDGDTDHDPFTDLKDEKRRPK